MSPPPPRHTQVNEPIAQVVGDGDAGAGGEGRRMGEGKGGGGVVEGKGEGPGMEALLMYRYGKVYDVTAASRLKLL